MILLKIYCNFHLEKVREILKVTTGFTEYQDKLGVLAERIIENEMHGHIVRPQCSCTQKDSEGKND